MKKIEFYKHNLTGIERNECAKVLRSLFLTTGSWVHEFEEKFARYLNMPHTVGLTSCTDALFLALRGLGITSGDEVITTPLSFIATSNTIEYCGAKPVFVDVEPSTGNIDAQRIESAITPTTRALLIVHLYGQMCDMRSIKKIADRHKLKIIEDCAHCIEGKRDGIRVGELSDAACFSFYATKNITSGEGGAVACRNDALYEWLLKARQHGMSKSAAERYTKKYEHYDMEFLGYKCNMTNIQAALLLHQLEKIDTFRKKKEAIANRYSRGFKKNAGIRILSQIPDTIHAWHLYTILVDPEKRDRYLSVLQDHGIGVAVNFRPIHLMKYYRRKYGFHPGDFPNAEYIGASTITLPLYPKLKRTETDYVIRTVNDGIRE